MKDLRFNILKKFALICVKIGVIGAVTYSIPFMWYEPEVPQSLLSKQK